MHESRARTIALICLVLVVGGFFYGTVRYVQVVREKSREAAEARTAAARRVPLPIVAAPDRYVEPAAITYPFF